MPIPSSTIFNYLSGTIDISGSKIFGAALTPNYTSGAEYLSDITGITDTVRVPAVLQRDTTSFGSGSVYLSAYQAFFPNVTPYNSYSFLFTYLSTGNPSNSRILNVAAYLPAAVGDTVFSYNESKVFYLQDTNYQGLFRNFRAKLLSGSLGNIANLNLKVALLSTSYSFDINAHQYISDISPYIVSTAAVSGVYLTYPNQVFTSSSNFMAFNGVPAGATVKNVIVYNNTGNNATSDLIGYYNDNSNTPLTSIGSTIYFKFYSQIIFAL